LTIHYDDESITTFSLKHLDIISFGIGNRQLYGKKEWSTKKYIQKEIFSYLKKQRVEIDLFFGHSHLINFGILRYLQKRFDKPLVWEANIIWGLPLRATRHLAIKLYRFLTEMFVFWQCNHIIAQTESSKQVIRKSYFIPENKISVLTNSVDLSLFTQKKKYPNKVLTLPLKVFVVGLFDELNGIKFLLDHISEFDQDSITLYLLGSGSQQERVTHLHHSGKLVFLGTAPYHKMPERLLEADLMLIPRIRCFLSNHFIPTKLLEAMACGLIVLGSDVDGITEVIRDGENGFIFEPGDLKDMVAKISLIKSLNNSVRNKVSGAAIQEIENHYNLLNNSKKINAIYREVLS